MNLKDKFRKDFKGIAGGSALFALLYGFIPAGRRFVLAAPNPTKFEGLDLVKDLAILLAMGFGSMLAIWLISEYFNWRNGPKP